ncbi:winged helix-turn-helix transcriptional regulator [Nocardia xishanensis]|uniref:Winged helix-turn-helix transcriptional regulator n=1 Tax=Nocardia xishanensis TaxID=238964 RepID=A0ABW7XCJ6_9NOCA
MRYEELADEPCSITRALVILGDRWTLLVLKAAFAGIRRFNAFQTSLGISRGRLLDRLDRLVEHGILTKRIPEGGGAYEEYRLTETGLEVYPVLMALRDWGDAHLAPDGPPLHYLHHDCGGEAHVRLECDMCAVELTARDVALQPGPGWPADS